VPPDWTYTRDDLSKLLDQLALDPQATVATLAKQKKRENAGALSSLVV
jgi:hypothetical protein